MSRIPGVFVEPVVTSGVVGVVGVVESSAQTIAENSKVKYCCIQGKHPLHH